MGNLKSWGFTLILQLVLVILFPLLGQSTNSDTPPDVTQAKAAAAAIVEKLKWQTGDVDIKNGLAKIHLTENFRFLNSEDARSVLEKLWGNPPNEETLGMIFPANLGPLNKNSWGVIISYEENGYVKDEDADKTNYDELLQKMKQEVKDENSERKAEGYPEIELVGWAAPPHYDKTTHKLYWAKEIKFEGEKENTLNYNIRILGRRGVLVLNAVAGIPQLADIEAKNPEILGMVDFQEGNRYVDFNPTTDKVAEYGIAALVAGGALAVATKVGMLKGLWLGIIFLGKYLVAFWKIIMLGLVAVGAAISKMWGNITGNSKKQL